MEIGNKIKTLRKSLGMTQGALALKLGVTPSAVGNYEHGLSFPKEEVLMRLFDALECSPNELLGDGRSLSPREKELLSKFGQLDERGKISVESLAETELQRTLSEELPSAARKGGSNEPLIRRSSKIKSVLDLPDYNGGRK